MPRPQRSAGTMFTVMAGQSGMPVTQLRSFRCSRSDSYA